MIRRAHIRHCFRRTRSLGVLRGAVAACYLTMASANTAETILPGDHWMYADPASVGIDPAPLQALDAGIRAGEYGNIDSMTIIRRGQIVFDRRYQWDYDAQHAGLVYPSPPPWDYFNPRAYPFHGETD